MHDTAYAIGQAFLTASAGSGKKIIVEVGSLDVNGSLREATPEGNIYLGLDVDHGPGVDLVVQPDSPLPFRNDFADIVITTSQLEHDSFFWLTFLELTRILKPGGLIYLNTPSNGYYHRYPQDVWRFYPDAGIALVKWGQRNGQALSLIESFIANRQTDIWNDFVAVFVKGNVADGTPLLSDKFQCSNVRTYKLLALDKENEQTEDQQIIAALREKIILLERQLALAVPAVTGNSDNTHSAARGAT